MFLETVVSGEQDLVVCAKKAYNDTLKRYHGWIVQGIFSVSVYTRILGGFGFALCGNGRQIESQKGVPQKSH